MSTRRFTNANSETQNSQNLTMARMTSALGVASGVGTTHTQLGTLTLKVPKVLDDGSVPSFIEHRKCSEQAPHKRY